MNPHKSFTTLDDCRLKDTNLDKKINFFISRISDERKKEIKKFPFTTKVYSENDGLNVRYILEYNNNIHSNAILNLDEYLYWNFLDENRKEQLFKQKFYRGESNLYEIICYKYECENGILKNIKRKPNYMKLEYYELVDPLFKEKLDVIFSTISDERKEEIRAYFNIECETVYSSMSPRYNSTVTRNDGKIIRLNLSFIEYLYWQCLDEERKGEFFKKSDTYKYINHIYDFI